MSCQNSSCCATHAADQPVSASGGAVDAANDATVGTNDTINSLIVHGSQVLTAVAGDVTQTKKTAIDAQTQIAESSIYAGTIVIIGILAIIGFLYYASVRKPA